MRFFFWVLHLIVNIYFIFGTTTKCYNLVIKILSLIGQFRIIFQLKIDFAVSTHYTRHSSIGLSYIRQRIFIAGDLGISIKLLMYCESVNIFIKVERTFLQLRSNSICFNARGFFKIDNRSLLKLSHQIFIYLIFFVQFSPDILGTGDHSTK